MSKLTPTHERYIDAPPQLVDAVRDDPEVLAKLSRAQLLLVQDKLTRTFLNSSDATVAQGVAVAEALRKTANLEPKGGPTGGAAGFSITINIPQVGQTAGATIEAKAPLIDVEDAEPVE